MSSLFDADDVQPRRPPRMPWHARWRRACGRARSTSSSGQEHLLAEGSALRGAIEQGRPHSMILYGPPGLGQDDAGADRGRRGPRRPRGAERRRGRAPGGAQGARARAAPPPAGRADGLLPRRDPSLQQGPAGRAAARGRGGPRHAHRGDDREPVLRGQLRAALALPGLRAAPAAGQRHRGRAAPRGGDARRRGRRRRDRLPGRARRRRRAHGAGGLRPRGQDPRPGDARGGRGRPAAARADLRQDRRPPLRHDLGLDQGHARLGPRRQPLLPRGHARRRRGPALHRAADGHPRLRGHRQRRPARARGRRRRGPGRSSTSACPRASSRSPRRPSTCRSRPKSDSAKKAIGAAREHVREHGAKPPPAYLQSAGYNAAARLGRGVGYDYPHDRPGHVSEQELLPDDVVGARFYSPDDAEAALRERLEEIRRARGR